MHAFKTLLIAVAMVTTSVSAEKQKCKAGAGTSTGFGSYSSGTWLHNGKGNKIGGNDDLHCSPGKTGNTIKGKGLDHEVKLDVDCDNGYIRHCKLEYGDHKDEAKGSSGYASSTCSIEFDCEINK